MLSTYLRQTQRGLFAALAGLLLSSTAGAAACGIGVCNGQVASVYVSTTGSIFVSMVGGLAGLTGCTPNAGIYAELPASAANSKLIYSMLIAAQYAGHTVTLRLQSDPTTGGCSILYAVSV